MAILTGLACWIRLTPLRRLAKRLGVLALVTVCSFGGTIHGDQSSGIPADLQVSLFSKILSYDRHLANSDREQLTIALVHQPAFPGSRKVADDLAVAYRRSVIRSISGFPVTVIAIAYQDTAGLQADVARLDVDIIYVAPLRGVDLREIARVAAHGRTLAITAVPEYVEKGMAVGLELRGSRPVIRINLTAARQQGADFSSQLLKLAEVILP